MPSIPVDWGNSNWQTQQFNIINILLLSSFCNHLTSIEHIDRILRNNKLPSPKWFPSISIFPSEILCFSPDFCLLTLSSISNLVGARDLVPTNRPIMMPTFHSSFQIHICNNKNVNSHNSHLKEEKDWKETPHLLLYSSSWRGGAHL